MKFLNKNRIKFILKSHPKFYNFFRVVYSAVVHPERLLKYKSYGDKYSEYTVLIIRPNAQDGMQGLMSLLVQTLRWIEYADRKGYIPVVDFKNYKTQYYVDGYNAWDQFFNQPSSVTLEEAYKCKNVVLSGVSLKSGINESLYKNSVFSDKKILDQCKRILISHQLISEEIWNIVEKEDELIHTRDCIGVYIRGTDYVKMKPVGEYKQPELFEVIDKIYEFKEKHKNAKIFLVTEDNDYYKAVLKSFKDDVVTVSFDSFVENYDGKDYLYKTGLLNEDIKKRGIDYLVKILLLSMCKYFIGTITNGSIIAYCYKEATYQDEFIFDLGYYH